MIFSWGGDFLPQSQPLLLKETLIKTAFLFCFSSIIFIAISSKSNTHFVAYFLPFGHVVWLVWYENGLPQSSAVPVPEYGILSIGGLNCRKSQGKRGCSQRRKKSEIHLFDFICDINNCAKSERLIYGQGYNYL